MTRLMTCTALAAVFAVPAFAQDDAPEVSYCEQAFAPADANSDNMIDSEEAIAARERQFADIDVNANGAITRDEWTTCTQSATDGRTLTAAPEDLFPQLDTDSSDDISPSELFNNTRNAYEDVWVKNHTRDEWDDPMIAMPSGITNEQMREWTSEEYFAQVGNTYAMTDTDDDGSVSRDEFMDRAQTHMMDISKVNSRFDEMDADADGSVTNEEFNNAAQARVDDAMRDMDISGEDGVPVVIWFATSM
ncbi:hypothetical protein [Loktanella sp. SALINAS62]|uniref:hypothetical protein n=1 Tax=Loktanella sp. SALINAS62 TaxID=2706124 RepID=UPI001B8B501A|nr:hypothetical protein [Loktanella sp. SALINAS62]MBS1302952.1 hypothetical protein [Loktanella sp. SALINAS62]